MPHTVTSARLMGCTSKSMGSHPREVFGNQMIVFMILIAEIAFIA